MPIDSVVSNKRPKPIVLIVLDGWGLSPSWGGNAIAMNNPPNMNKYWRQFPHCVLQAFMPIAGEAGTIANSEIGHASIGTGRMIEPDLNEINTSIKNGSFFKNDVLVDTCQEVVKKNSNLHLVGLISDGAVHSHIAHLYALLKLAKENNVKNVYIHAITDGRDVSSTSAIKYLTNIKKKIDEIGCGKIATIVGRYYAMDRNDNWNNIEEAYKAEVEGVGKNENDPLKAISDLYRQGYTDEFIPPTVIVEKNKPIARISDNDNVIFFNFRADRARELTRAYLDPKALRSVITRKHRLLKINFVSLTDYKINFPNLSVAFQPAVIESNLAKILADHGYKQLHIAESEKYAHVTYFFNGGAEKANAGEDRIIIPSAKVVSYDQKPEMSADEITSKVTSAIKSNKYDFILVNYANVDMIGHTGNILAASKAVEVVDNNLGRVVEEVLKADGMAIITADHGNVEQMISVEAKDKDPETLHSLNPVPFLIISKKINKNLFKSAYKSNELLISDILSSKHTLADIAPTILEIMNIAKPTDMTGSSLLNKLE